MATPAPQTGVGQIYFSGLLGVPQDHAQAVTWYRKAADQGYGLAQQFLGEMYENAWGVPQDYAQAHMWFNLWGLRVGDMVPKGERGRILENGSEHPR
jgi:TPR repeat protein